MLYDFRSTHLLLQQSLGVRNVSSRALGEEESYWKMFLIMAQIFSKCFFLFFFFSVAFSGAECK